MQNVELHYIQIEIIKQLALNPQLIFSKLQIEGLASEHMNYHLKKLIKLGYVKKDNEYYKLTDFGKDYSNLMDDNIKLLEKQPKSSVLIMGVRENNNNIEFLLSKRLRQPYYGKLGRITGKIRFGETFREAARRELYEETGLKAKTLVLEEIYHKIRYNEDNTYVQDVIFYVFFATDFSGDFISKLPYQENIWASKTQIEQLKMDLFDGLVLEDRLEPKKLSISEDIALAEGY